MAASFAHWSKTPWWYKRQPPQSWRLKPTPTADRSRTTGDISSLGSQNPLLEMRTWNWELPLREEGPAWAEVYWKGAPFCLSGSPETASRMQCFFYDMFEPEERQNKLQSTPWNPRRMRNKANHAEKFWRMLCGSSGSSVWHMERRFRTGAKYIEDMFSHIFSYYMGKRQWDRSSGHQSIECKGDQFEKKLQGDQMIREQQCWRA